MDHFGRVLLHLARPRIGNDVPHLVRELSGLRGVRHVEPISKPPRLLIVEHDRRVIDARALLARIRRGWSAVRLLDAGA